MKNVFALMITMLLGASLMVAQGGGSNTTKVDPARKATNNSKKGSGISVAGANRRPSPGSPGANGASKKNNPAPTPSSRQSSAK